MPSQNRAIEWLTNQWKCEKKVQLATYCSIQTVKERLRWLRSLPFYRWGERGSGRNGDSPELSQQVTTGPEERCLVQTRATAAKCIIGGSQVRTVLPGLLSFSGLQSLPAPLRSIMEKGKQPYRIAQDCFQGGRKKYTAHPGPWTLDPGPLGIYVPQHL